MMLPDKLLDQIKQLAETHAKAETCRALAHTADLDTEAAHLRARADFWDSQLSDQWANLTAALNSALPPTIYARPGALAPVRVPNEHDIEVRGSLDNGNRAVSIRFSAAQAVAVGTAMIACAAAGTQRTGGQLAAILPPLPVSPPDPPTRPT